MTPAMRAVLWLTLIIFLAIALSGSKCYDESRQLVCDGADEYWRETEALRI